MGVLAWPGQAMADLALALTAAADRADAGVNLAVRAATELIGDCAGVRLIREDGGYDRLTMQHPEPGRAHDLAERLELAVVLPTIREPVVLPPEALPAAGVTACVLLPIVTDTAYLGYLVLARTEPGTGYTDEEIDLGRDIAGELALALGSARAAERVRVSEERYRCIAETTLEGVWQLDAEGTIRYVNEAMAELLGLPREQLLGLSVHGFLDSRGQSELSRWIDECRQGRCGVFETRLVRADGGVRWVQVSAAPLPDDHGQPGWSLCMVTDITDRIQARGLKRQLDHLRRLDSLGQLIGGIAHDFNNLLTVVAGSAEMIAGEAAPASAEHRLATEIVDAAVRGRTLAHQLLAFGRGGGRVVTVSVSDLLDDVQQLLSRTLGEHIKLDISADADVSPVRAERGPLEQALVNLAANARDAMPRGGVLTIQATNVDIEPGQLDDAALAGRFVRLVVADTGAGMDHETRARAFEPFFTTKPTAAGLGLATAASIIRGAGGHIQLDSEPRIGTTVRLFLPAAPATATPAAPAPIGTHPVGHLLVVEDQPELAQLIQHLLEPAGYTVTVLTDPQSAIAGLPDGITPGLLLTDVVMPGMTGPELAAALRERYPDLRVVYMSGYAAAVLDDDANLVQKPFTRDTLLAAVERAWR
jgi:two-component system, cell cycle sensor histidine kinase and response regulator CckA